MEDIEIKTGDFRKLSEKLEDDTIDLILTDPPYPREYLPLWADLGRVAARVLKPSAYLVAYSGSVWLGQIMAMLDEHLEYYVLMANLEPGAESRINARAMFQEFKPILVYQKPPIKRLNKWGPNSITSPAPSKAYHKWGQSLPPVRELLERFSDPGNLVLEPFLGGGTTALACQQTDRRCIAYEIDAGAADKARARVAGFQMSIFSTRTLEALVEQQEPEIRMATCQFCHQQFPTVRADAHYCKNACRQAAYRMRRKMAVCCDGA